MKTSHIVQGYGPLDIFLAKQRYKTATRRITSASRNGRILDIGCGSYPLFLANVDFAEKCGLDKDIATGTEGRGKQNGITLINHCIEEEQKLPFEDNYFDVVTMLAVFEHIEPAELVRIHAEIFRVLKPAGMYVMTTPAFWTDRLLRFMAKLHLISDVSIKEHKDSYSRSRISSVLQQAGFQESKLQFGYFELFMNTWATAAKQTVA